jgi:hypothetical protein
MHKLCESFSSSTASIPLSQCQWQGLQDLLLSLHYWPISGSDYCGCNGYISPKGKACFNMKQNVTGSMDTLKKQAHQTGPSESLGLHSKIRGYSLLHPNRIFCSPYAMRGVIGIETSGKIWCSICLSILFISSWTGVPSSVLIPLIPWTSSSLLSQPLMVSLGYVWQLSHSSATPTIHCYQVTE